VSDVSIRGYRAGDEHGIVDLFHRRFHPDRTLEHWRWKFRDHPLGRGLVSVAVDRHGGISAHCAGYPTLLVDARPRSDPGTPQALPCLHIGDVMADPCAVRAGLSGSVFESTFRHLRQQVRSADMPFMYGVAAGAIDRFYARKMQRGTVAPIAYRRCAPVPFAERIQLTGADNHGLSVERVERPTVEFDELFHRVGARYGVLARRDAAYVGWRYSGCPDRVHCVYALRSGGRIAGWSVFRRVGSRLVWGDALIDPAHADGTALLLDEALRRQGAGRVDVVEAWFPAHPDWWERQLDRLGFTTSDEPQGLKLVYVCATGEPVDPSQMAGSLYYTMGDTDLF
jgi:hypothetical protein